MDEIRLLRKGVRGDDGEELRFPLADSIAGEHRALLSTMRWIAAELARAFEREGGPEHDGPLLGPLKALKQELMTHFEVEEREVLLPLARSRNSTLRILAGELLREHTGFCERLDRLIGQLEVARRPGGVIPSSLRRDVETIFDDLRCHETRERSLLKSAAEAGG